MSYVTNNVEIANPFSIYVYLQDLELQTLIKMALNINKTSTS